MKTFLLVIVLFTCSSRMAVLAQCNCPTPPRNITHSSEYYQSVATLISQQSSVSNDLEAVVEGTPFKDTFSHSSQYIHNNNMTTQQAATTIQRELSFRETQIIAEVSSTLCQLGCIQTQGNANNIAAIDALTRICLSIINPASVSNLSTTANSPILKFEPDRLIVYYDPSISTKTILRPSIIINSPSSVRVKNEFGDNRKISGKRHLKLPAIGNRELKLKVKTTADRNQALQTAKITTVSTSNAAVKAEASVLLIPAYDPYPSFDLGTFRPRAIANFPGYASKSAVDRDYELFFAKDGETGNILHGEVGGQITVPAGDIVLASSAVSINASRKKVVNAVDYTFSIQTNMYGTCNAKDPSLIFGMANTSYQTKLYIADKHKWKTRVVLHQKTLGLMQVEPGQSFVVTLRRPGFIEKITKSSADSDVDKDITLDPGLYDVEVKLPSMKSDCGNAQNTHNRNSGSSTNTFKFLFEPVY